MLHVQYAQLDRRKFFLNIRLMDIYGYEKECSENNNIKLIYYMHMFTKKTT